MQPEAILDAVTRSHPRAICTLVAVSLLMFLPGFFSIPPTDRDESYFAQTAKQMIESGTYGDVRIRSGDEAFYTKPPGTLWGQAGYVVAMRALGFGQALNTIWAYRVPSLISAIAATSLTYWTALGLVRRRAALFAALMMASSMLLAVEARTVSADATLLVTSIAAMGALARVYLSGHGGPSARWPMAAVFWTAVAAGVLVKGPVVPVVAALAVLALAVHDRSIRWLASLRPFAGLVWVAALTLLWFVPISRQAGPAFSRDWAAEIFPKLLNGMQGHGAPPGYFAAFFWVTFWPGCALALLAVPAVFAARRTPATTFLLAWLLPSWIGAELAFTKLPHYVLPLYPSVAILVAGAVGTPAWSRRPALLKGAIWLAVVPLLLGAASIAALAVLDRQWSPLGCVLCAGAVVSAFLGWRQLVHERAERALLFAVTAAFLLSTGVGGVILPRLRAAFPAANVADLIDARGCRQPRTMTTSFDEPSLVFLAGTTTRRTDVAGAVRFLAEGPCRFVVIGAHDEPRFIDIADAAHMHYRTLGRVDGINYNEGLDALTLTVYWSGAER